MICVTGNNGFIGKALETELIKQGHKVKGLEKWIYLRDRWQDRLIEYLVDMNPEAVFHVGACSDTQNKDVTEMMTLNVHATNIIASWCEFKNIPMIYSSSAATYGTKGTPQTLYAWSKFLGEEFAIKSKAVALRYFNVYGIGEAHKGKMASIAHQMFMKHKDGEQVKLFPNKPMRDFVYIKDVVDANIYAWKNYESLKGGWFDVGTGKAATFEQVLDILNIPYTYAEMSEMPDHYQTFTEAYHFMPDWRAQYSLEKGLKEYKNFLNLSLVHI